MRALSLFAPPLALMAVVFALSAQPDLGTGFGVWDLIGRKLAHMATYGLLWWLWWRALGRRRPAAAAVIAIAYAVSDEYHQSLVEGRVGSPLDVAIDAVGVAFAWRATALRLRASRAR